MCARRARWEEDPPLYRRLEQEAEGEEGGGVILFVPPPVCRRQRRLVYGGRSGGRRVIKEPSPIHYGRRFTGRSKGDQLERYAPVCPRRRHHKARYKSTSAESLD